jgi:hypothetical protein
VADTVTSQLLENGSRNWAYQFANLSDGTGETGVTKVDGSASGPLGVLLQGITYYPKTHIKVTYIEANVIGMSVVFLWDATSALQFYIAAGSSRIGFRKTGPLFIPVGTVGATGKILFTTKGAAANASYSITLMGTKGIQR